MFERVVKYKTVYNTMPQLYQYKCILTQQAGTTLIGVRFSELSKVNKFMGTHFINLFLGDYGYFRAGTGLVIKIQGFQYLLNVYKL